MLFTPAPSFTHLNLIQKASRHNASKESFDKYTKHRNISRFYLVEHIQIGHVRKQCNSFQYVKVQKHEKVCNHGFDNESTSETYTYASTVNTRIPTNVMHSMIKYYKQKVKVEQILGKLTSNVKTKHLKGYNPQQYGTVLKSTKKTNYRPGSKVLIATILGE